MNETAWSQSKWGVRGDDDTGDYGGDGHGHGDCGDSDVFGDDEYDYLHYFYHRCTTTKKENELHIKVLCNLSKALEKMRSNNELLSLQLIKVQNELKSVTEKLTTTPSPPQVTIIYYFRISL